MEPKSTSKRYHVAHVRGPTYERLRELGFIVLYPAADDYVFLEICDKNKKLLNKQTELCISFLKKKERLISISERELQTMIEGITERSQDTGDVEVISGYCAGLDGRIVEANGDRYRCNLKGFNREYNVWVDKLDLVFKPEKDQGTGIDG